MRSGADETLSEADKLLIVYSRIIQSFKNCLERQKVLTNAKKCSIMCIL